MTPLLAPIFGSFFIGAYLPQKLTPKSSIEMEHKHSFKGTCLLIRKKKLNQYPLVGLRLEPLAVTPNQSGGTTAPIDGVSVILVETQIF
jgi:hypothetical protein